MSTYRLQADIPKTFLHGTRMMRAAGILLFAVLLARTAYAETETGTGKKSLKIISFNTWFGLDGKGVFRMGELESGQKKEKRYQGLVAGLREYDPDILFIQEANPLPRYVRRLAKDVGMNEIHAVNNGGVRVGPVGIPTNLRMGIAILAKRGLKLKKVGTHRTSGAGIVSNFFCFHLSEVRVLLAGVVYPNDEPLYLFCLHTHASVPDIDEYRNKLKELLAAQKISPGEREDYANRLASSFARTEEDISRSIPYIKEITRDHGPFIVGGDFNAYPPVFPSMTEFIGGMQLIDSFAVANPHQAGYTWDPSRNANTKCDGADTWADGKVKNPLERLQAHYDGTVHQRIDFIFLSNHFTPEDVLDSTLVFDEPYGGIYVSDHFGVMTEVAFR
ncbi:MAG: endonuclease/exonuclease/phosphatase family protein [Candidatus Hydrogenedentota bacterium]|nr:MAG: endonuclease/exonuclease/phosphatase family protein [Candidatus Hydrogenedentota bacterium]